MRGMNKLAPRNARPNPLHAGEGSSMRSISRVAGVSINTVTKLLIERAWLAGLPRRDGARRQAKARPVR